ncbi:Smr/MutS family protein [Acetobacteraceae bacterium KSS8]|uniref:Smr/MutS family protein n=1 Tax=Endosaccharibacter trunci TaxID=2812733 RepID=A0ABT1W8P9_9PROT|nr:Smr/MutS family protein [Acetobacteraceae bacterium KSS8]
MAARRLREGELSLWFETMRGVRPLRPGAMPKSDETAPTKPAEPAPKAAEAETTRPAARALRPRMRPIDPFPVIGERQPGLDDTSWRMLGSGKMRPQRRLDLHGRHAEAAFGLLHGFLLRAYADRLRCVEIITGAGSGPEGGILRRELPHWLARADLRPLVLAAVHPHARNVGSVRLLLRRRPL